MIFSYDVSELAPYINWAYFYFAWQVKQNEEQQRLHEEAVAMLQSFEGMYRCRALFQLLDAHSEGDDIVLDGISSEEDAVRKIPCLRQQSGNPCLCLSDYISPRAHSASASSQIGLFATSADSGLERDFDDDPYQKMMAQLLADRLAEAAAERLHELVRKELWGYAADEQLSVADMHQERFKGIRPAVGYPSLPDASINFLLDRLLDFSQIGISLTESGAMRPHASVSGLMIAHPEARYFSVGKIGTDQLSDYARRRHLPLSLMRKFLSASL